MAVASIHRSLASFALLAAAAGPLAYAQGPPQGAARGAAVAIAPSAHAQAQARSQIALFAADKRR